MFSTKAFKDFGAKIWLDRIKIVIIVLTNQSAFQSTSLTCLAVFPSKTWITFTRVTVYIIDTFTMRTTRLACTFVNIWEQKIQKIQNLNSQG